MDRTVPNGRSSSIAAGSSVVALSSLSLACTPSVMSLTASLLVAHDDCRPAHAEVGALDLVVIHLRLLPSPSRTYAPRDG